MSRKLLAVLLSELVTVRIKCMKCGKVAEMTVKEMGDQYAPPTCPMCRQMLSAIAGQSNPFVSLSQSIEDLKRHTSTVEVEFVLPDPS